MVQLGLAVRLRPPTPAACCTPPPPPVNDEHSRSAERNDIGDIDPSFRLDDAIDASRVIMPGDVDRMDMSRVRLEIMSDVSEVMEFWQFWPPAPPPPKIPPPPPPTAAVPMPPISSMLSQLPPLTLTAADKADIPLLAPVAVAMADDDSVPAVLVVVLVECAAEWWCDALLINRLPSPIGMGLELRDRLNANWLTTAFGLPLPPPVFAVATAAGLTDRDLRGVPGVLGGVTPLPLARLAPITLTSSLTDTPCSSGGMSLLMGKATAAFLAAIELEEEEWIPTPAPPTATP